MPFCPGGAFVSRAPVPYPEYYRRHGNANEKAERKAVDVKEGRGGCKEPAVLRELQEHKNYRHGYGKYKALLGLLCLFVKEDLGCRPTEVFTRVTLPLSVPGIISGFTMVFVPAVSTFYISQKMGSSGTTLIGDVIESQFKAAYNPNLGAALSLGLMVLVLAGYGG